MTPALFWDIDGTLLSTGRAGIIAFERAAEDVCGRAAGLDDLPTAGLTDAEVAVRVVEAAGGNPEDVPAVLAAYERYLPECLPLREGRVLPGVTDILDDLTGDDGIGMRLLTGNTRAGAQAKLAYYGLDRYFEGGAFCDGVCGRDAIAEEARAWAADRNEPLYVIGDTPHDVRCGNAIGARTVAVATGSYSAADLEATGAWLVLEQLPAPSRFRELLQLNGRRQKGARAASNLGS